MSHLNLPYFFLSEICFRSTDGFVYDVSNHLVKAVKGRYGNKLRLTYDQRGLVTQEKLNIVNVRFYIHHEYDLDNRRTQTRYPSNTYINTEFDGRSSSTELPLIVVIGAIARSNLYLMNMTMQVEIRLVRFGNGVVENRTFNADNTLSQIEHNSYRLNYEL